METVDRPKMKEKRRAEVLVVGAGPVGLFTALCLADRGLRVTIIDKYQRSALHSYALALHPYSLCLLDEVDLAVPLIEKGQRIDRIALYADGEARGRIEIGEVGGPFPFVLALPQTYLESALERALRKRGVVVQWHHTLFRLVESRKTMEAYLVGTRPQPAAEEGRRGPIQQAYRLHASWVVGADGQGSFTRRLAGIDQVTTGPTQTYELYQFQSPVDRQDEMRLMLNGSNTDVLWPLGPGGGRFGFQVDEAPGEPPGMSELRARLESRAPWFGPPPDELEWATAVAFAPCLASSFGEGRVWFAGDAGRMTGPIGVQNMNVGLREAHGLAHRLTAVQKGTASATVLEQYGRQRKQEWSRLLGTDSSVRLRPDAPAWVRPFAARLVSSLPGSAGDLDCLLGQLGVSLGP